MVVFGWWRVLFQLYPMYSILLKPVVHKYGRGTRLGTCLVYATYVMAVVACINGDQFYIIYLLLLHRLCIGMDEASALVHAYCMPRGL